MKKKQNIILVPTDFSTCGNNALQYAIDSAKDYNAKIIVMHAYQTFFLHRDKTGNILPENELITKTKSDEKLEKLCVKLIKDKNISCDYETMSVFGPPSEMILKTINKVNPTFVVMGIREKKELKEKLKTDHTVTISQNAKSPVIVVPEHIKYHKINKITFATDYHTSDISSIRNLALQAKQTKMHLIVLHISDGELSQDFEKQMLDNFSARIKKETNYANISYILTEGKDVKTELEKYVKTKATDIFALSTSTNGWLERLFGTSITSRILHKSKVPLITYHNKGEQDNLY